MKRIRSPKKAAASTTRPRVQARPAPGGRGAKVGGSTWIRLGASGIHGQGIYARTAIPAGTRVIEYIGELITKAESERREEQRLAAQRRGEDGCVTIFDLNKRYDLDGRTKRNVARLINHSCAPNCRSEQSRGRIWIVARRDIPEGEELTFDYGYSLSNWELHPCRCGAPRCPGFIVGAGQRWRLRRVLRQLRRPTLGRAA